VGAKSGELFVFELPVPMDRTTYLVDGLPNPRGGGKTTTEIKTKEGMNASSSTNVFPQKDLGGLVKSGGSERDTQWRERGGIICSRGRKGRLDMVFISQNPRAKTR